MAKLKPFSEIVRQNVQNYLNQNLVIRRFLENGFESIVTSKTNVFSVKEQTLFSFLQILSDEVEGVFWESKTMLRKVFAQSLLCLDLFRKCFSVLI